MLTWLQRFQHLHRQVLSLSTNDTSPSLSHSSSSSSAQSDEGLSLSPEMLNQPQARDLFVQHELLRMEFKHSSVDGSASIDEVIKESDQVRALFSMKRGVEKKTTRGVMGMYIKIVVVTLYTLLTIIASLFLMPLRLLHPALRSLGVPNHFLPIDFSVCFGNGFLFCSIHTVVVCIEQLADSDSMCGSVVLSACMMYRVQKFFCRGWLSLCGVYVVWEGLENVNYHHPMIGMFSHASNMDPIIVASGPYAFKWIAKRSLFKVPFMGWVLAGWGHFPIDRKNRPSAVKALNHAVATVQYYSRCLAVSPEGTRSVHGTLQDFKKGPFHTCIQAGFPVQPMVIQGAYELWPPRQLFPTGGIVRIKLLPRIELNQGEDHNQLSARVRRAMLEAIRAPPKRASSFAASPLYILWLPVTLLVMWYTLRLCLWNFSSWF